MLKLAFIAALVGCSPTYYVGSRIARAKNTCPTTAMVIGDLVIAGGMLAIATIKDLGDHPNEAAGWGASGFGLFTLVNVSEVLCRK